MHWIAYRDFASPAGLKSERCRGLFGPPRLSRSFALPMWHLSNGLHLRSFFWWIRCRFECP
jgi:hypothetical protein